MFQVGVFVEEIPRKLSQDSVDFRRFPSQEYTSYFHSRNDEQIYIICCMYQLETITFMQEGFNFHMSEHHL